MTCLRRSRGAGGLCGIVARFVPQLHPPEHCTLGRPRRHVPQQRGGVGEIPPFTNARAPLVRGVVAGALVSRGGRGGAHRFPGWSRIEFPEPIAFRS